MGEHEIGYRKTGQARLGFGTSARGTLITNFSTSTRRGAGERRNRRRVVVGFHLHQDVRGFV